jgi:hypothetical protein
MQHACYRCGAPVEDGTPFCRQCNAPQIKVVASEPSLPQEILESHSEPLTRVSDQAPAQSRPIDWRNALPSIFFIAIPAGLLSVPLNLLFFIWTFAAGAISVSTYRKRTHASVSSSMAARLGLLTGVVAFAVFLLVFLTAMTRPDFAATMRGQMKAAIDRSLASSSDPAAKQLAATFSSPDGMATLLTLVLGLFAFLFILFSVLGAIAGATIFAPKNRAP